jgi:hypothetical protein
VGTPATRATCQGKPDEMSLARKGPSHAQSRGPVLDASVIVVP